LRKMGALCHVTVVMKNVRESSIPGSYRSS
jgi:hypothetical protein